MVFFFKLVMIIKNKKNAIGSKGPTNGLS